MGLPKKDEQLLQASKVELVRKGFTPYNRLEDKSGVYGYIMHAPGASGEAFYFAAKKSLYGGLASFMEVLVRRAEDHDGWLLLYRGDEREFLVFDSEYVSERGEESRGKSKKREVSWLELPASDGVTLSEFSMRNERPEMAAQTRPTGLDRYY